MKLKRIEMYGFKSFADKLELQFEDGVNAIVGPNGCGKSNVADAIRWVLGEQSAKTLRGNSMTDVIFSGTAARKSLSYSEVSLVFDNTKREVALDLDELILTRKLYRSGESEYMVSRQPARLKDIVDLLREIGAGKEGYSIIGQGKVDEIITSKPEDRRGIFEDACGISKFKARKVETERKLARTHDNLLRLNDIITELERQLRPLEKQSADARTYLELKDHLKYHEINYFIHQFESVNEVKDQIRARIAELEEEIGDKTAESRKTSEQYDALMARMNGLDGEIAQKRDEQLALSLGLEKQSGELRLIRERIRMFSETLEKNEGEREALLAAASEAAAALEQNREQSARNAVEEAALSEELAAADKRYLDIVEMISRGETETESSQAEMVSQIERLSDIKANYASLVSEKKALGEQREDLKAKLAAVETEQRGFEAELEEVRARRGELESARGERLNEQRRLDLKREEISLKLQEVTKSVSALENRITDMQAREKLLSRIQENFEGYSMSVRMLLSDAKRHPELSEKISGTVAHLMSVPQKYEVAVDVTLGQGMQNVIVPREADAKALIAYLKEKRYGRVTFLPVETVKGRVLDEPVKKLLSTVDGFLGVAVDLVQFAPEHKQIYASLLGRTAVADNLDNAVKLARKCNYSVRIVTLDGDVIHPFGAMTGGSRKAEASNLLSGERELSDLRENLKKAAEKLTEWKAAAERGESKLAETAGRAEELSSAVRELEVEIARESEKEERTRYLLEERERDYASLADQNYALGARLDKLESDLKQVDELESSVLLQKDSATSESNRRKQEFEQFKRERDAAHERMTELKVRMADLKNAGLNLRAEAERLSEAEQSRAERRQRLDEEHDNLTATLADLEKAAEQVFIDSGAQAKLDEIKAELLNLDERKRTMQEDLAEKDRRRGELAEEVSRLTERKYREENSMVKVDTDMENLAVKIQEDYGLDFEAASAQRDPDYQAEGASSEINRTKKQISALGYVNVNAIDDFKAVKERYDEMAVQKEDLDKAEADLKQIISELTTEMLERFNRGFTDISVNFQRVFKELFGGGNAKLVLTEPEDGDPLSAGVDIVAEPPGKKLQSITLLSGGEKALTAIAILFAILKLRPMPFCVLDEIEAALDDANTDRFARYLKKFSQDTQFIVITHKKPTMERADVIYGVTMEEKGVSKMVSVKLTEAVEMIKEA